ncbi:hypothetical protein OS493_012957 [Desmophyllum pertusum]|uniref:Protein kinase domain-containing protein n=1 Tax=Desmophyllum pertusum TaxID=174260 RepID=A0A9X0CRV6_9CNID|nr:hypothetical protein OS493_012957 [Desmophyllum pertusum]
MEDEREEKQNRVGKFKSHPHSKKEKQKQHKAWLKRKREVQQNEPTLAPEKYEPPVNIPMQNAELEVQQNETTLAPEKYEPLVNIPMQNAELEVQQNETTLAPEKYEPPVNIPMQNAIVEESHGKPNTITGIISRGKQMVKMATNGKRKSEEEEAHRSTLSFNITPVENSSVTLLMAASTGIIANDEQCAIIMKETCEALAHLHSRGYLHNDLKGNNVVLDGEKHRPIIIDFGKSVKISKAKLRKPKLNVKKATKRYPRIAPELHRGERQSTASDMYSFGALINRVLEKGKFEMHALQKIAKACLSTNPGKRPGLDEVLRKLTN